MDLAEIEQAARLAWPALEEQELPFGVLRYAQGVSRRANSLNVFPEARFDGNELIEIAEQFFSLRGVASIVRVLQCDNKLNTDLKDLDRLLEASDYALRAPTQQMLVDLREVSALMPRTGSQQLAFCELNQWLQHWYEFAGRDAGDRQTHLSMLGNIEHTHRFFVFLDNRQHAVSCGMAVLSGRAMGISAVATAGSVRGQGYGRKLLHGILDWGLRQRADYAHLQVETANQAALALYKEMGFRQHYSYWYRVKPLFGSKFLNGRET